MVSFIAKVVFVFSIFKNFRGLSRLLDKEYIDQLMEEASEAIKEEERW